MIEGFMVTIGVILALIAFPFILIAIGLALAYIAKFLDWCADTLRGKK